MVAEEVEINPATGRPRTNFGNHRPWRPDWSKIERMFDVMRSGIGMEAAARAVGLSRNSVNEWYSKGSAMREGREHPKVSNLSDRRMIEFADRVDAVREETEALCVGRIIRASESDWRAGAWYLERSNPQKWGRSIKTEISGPGGTPITLRAEPAQPIDAETLDRLEQIMDRVKLGQAPELPDPDRIVDL